MIYTKSVCALEILRSILAVRKYTKERECACILCGTLDLPWSPCVRDLILCSSTAAPSPQAPAPVTQFYECAPCTTNNNNSQQEQADLEQSTGSAHPGLETRIHHWCYENHDAQRSIRSQADLWSWHRGIADPQQAAMRGHRRSLSPAG